MDDRSGSLPVPVDSSSQVKGDAIEERRRKLELLGELRGSWESNEPISAEELINRWPGAPEATDVASLLLEEYLQRQKRGKDSSLDDYRHRFPAQADALAGMISQHELLCSIGGSGSSEQGVRLPGLGDRLFRFRLRQALGEGAFARVFLAEQIDLGGRPVVLKVSALEGSEPQTLAQLQHTHIVPIHSLHDDPRAGLRVICMPYYGGASLSRVLEAVDSEGENAGTGRALLEALDRASAALPRPEVALGRASGGSPREQLARLDYVRAAVWMIARLAEGLQHAHHRGVLHRDIKPSNILICADGQPMLLDFNLSQEVAGLAGQALLGGTVAYMAPEHLRALATRAPELVVHVDHRSDIYSLGMVLFEMLAGQSPFHSSASYHPLPLLIESMAVERGKTIPSLREACPDAPWSLESILRRCLAPAQEDRYQSAGELADDLNCFVNDFPLHHAPELSLRERGEKWARRHPRLCVAGLVAAVACVLIAVPSVLWAIEHSQLAHTQEALEVKTAREDLARFNTARLRALYLVNTTFVDAEYAQQAVKACETALSVWHVLEEVERSEPAEWRWLEDRERQQLRENVRELLLLLADTRVHLAPGDATTLTEAVALLDRAQSLPGMAPCRALHEERAAFRADLGDPTGARADRDAAAQIEPATGRDFYLLAVRASREGHSQEALRLINSAVVREPHDYWYYMLRGLYRLELNQPSVAIAEFGTCVGLWPEFAWGYFNRAVALSRCGEAEAAIADYDRALRIDPGLTAAHFNRGILHLELKHHADALADFDDARRGGRDDAAVHTGRGVALARLDRMPEAEKEFAEAKKLCANLSRALRARQECSIAFGRASRDRPATWKAAWEEFTAAYTDDPRSPHAAYGFAMILEWDNRAKESLHWYGQALELSPGFVEARAAYAVALARAHDHGRAKSEIKVCLSQDTHSGQTPYAAACVVALALRQEGVDRGPAVKEAIGLLRAAQERGYNLAEIGEDPDLAEIRAEPEFQTLLKAVRKSGENLGRTERRIGNGGIIVK
jgi:eukaryotic-like serine/threonine-protein kinase